MAQRRERSATCAHSRRLSFSKSKLGADIRTSPATARQAAAPPSLPPGRLFGVRFHILGQLYAAE
jgi:hypothetical protein